jgi:hypothetical protein
MDMLLAGGHRTMLVPSMISEQMLDLDRVGGVQLTRSSRPD